MKKENKKLKARDAFKIFAENYFRDDFGNLSNKQRSLALIHFYISKIYCPIHSCYISDEEIDQGLTDGAGDLDVDFIHRDDNTVLILQARYHTDNTIEEAKNIEYFQNIFKRLLDPKLKKNTRLGDALGAVDYENDNFILRYVTFAKFVGQAEQQVKKEPSIPASVLSLDDRASFEFLDEPRLTLELRTAESVTAGLPQESFELFAAGPKGHRSPVIDIQAGDYKSCILVVEASQIISLYRHNNVQDALFTMNIRNYVGNTKTNKEIISSARNFADRFFYYNNGISCLATEMEVSGDRVRAKGLQVINGAQTVKALVRAGGNEKDNPWKGKSGDPLVLIRITEALNYGRDGSFREEVIKYNNTQNLIKNSDFRSNDPIQNDLKKRFSDIVRFGKHVEYIPKRTDKIKPNSEPIRIEEFAKVVYSYLGDPIKFSGSTSFLFDESENGGYKQIFGDGTIVWAEMPNDEFKLRSAIWWLGSSFGEKLIEDRKKVTDPIAKAALERKWMIIFASRLILERSFGEINARGVISKFFEGKWKLGIEDKGKWFEDLYGKSKGVVSYVYTQDSKNDNFVHRNWMRNPKTVQKLRDFASTAPIQVMTPPPI